jgi:predicted ABC-type sugar transport system permease subunit
MDTFNQLILIKKPAANEVLFASNDATVASGNVDLTVYLIIGISAIKAKSSTTIKKQVLSCSIAGKINHTTGSVLLDAAMPAIKTNSNFSFISRNWFRSLKYSNITADSIETVSMSA